MLRTSSPSSQSVHTPPTENLDSAVLLVTSAICSFTSSTASCFTTPNNKVAEARWEEAAGLNPARARVSRQHLRVLLGLLSCSAVLLLLQTSRRCKVKSIKMELRHVSQYDFSSIESQSGKQDVNHAANATSRFPRHATRRAAVTSHNHLVWRSVACISYKSFSSDSRQKRQERCCFAIELWFFGAWRRWPTRYLRNEGCPCSRKHASSNRRVLKPLADERSTTHR